MLGIYDRRSLEVPTWLLLAFLVFSVFIASQTFQQSFIYLYIVAIACVFILSAILAPNLADALVFISASLAWGPFSFLPIVFYSITSIPLSYKPKAKEHPALWRWFFCCLVSYIIIFFFLALFS